MLSIRWPGDDLLAFLNSLPLEGSQKVGHTYVFVCSPNRSITSVQENANFLHSFYLFLLMTLTFEVFFHLLVGLRF